MDPKSLPKVLYIEDTPDARSLVSRVLARDFIVLEAGDPLSGIELAIETEPDLILLDINLPHLSGREVAARLKRLLPNTTLVAFTADTSPGARERALAAGCVGYLTKPLDVDTFPDEVAAFLKGKREDLPDRARHEKAFQDELVERLEDRVRQLTKTAERNDFLNEQNKILIAGLQRRQHLLEAAARVGHTITSILHLDELLRVTVDVICEEYGFDYAGIFLLDAASQWAVLRAGRGTPGQAMLEAGYQIPLDQSTVVGAAINTHQACNLIDLDNSAHPSILGMHSEIALPLDASNRVLGALTVLSVKDNAFQDEDVAALQTLANHVATAIDNALLLQDLEHANQELLRNKTLAAIATTTGETIHWVANKAAPIPASARRVREDLVSLVALFHTLLDLPSEQRQQHPMWPEMEDTFHTLIQQGFDLQPPAFILPGTLESIFEDLSIIEQGATSILDVKEDLIGPVRLQHPEEINIPDLLDQTIFQMALPNGVIHTDYAPGIPHMRGDIRQIGQVFNNLIKNAWEATFNQPNPSIQVTARLADETASQTQRYIQVQVSDNGPGIPPGLLDKIWVSFFTTKSERGGTGLGLSACLAIINQFAGKISVESKVGSGTTFTILLPVTSDREGSS